MSTPKMMKNPPVLGHWMFRWLRSSGDSQGHCNLHARPSGPAGPTGPAPYVIFIHRELLKTAKVLGLGLAGWCALCCFSVFFCWGEVPQTWCVLRFGLFFLPFLGAFWFACWSLGFCCFPFPWLVLVLCWCRLAGLGGVGSIFSFNYSVCLDLPHGLERL